MGIVTTLGLRVFRTLENELRCLPIDRSIVRVERSNYYVSTSHRGCLNYLYDGQISMMLICLSLSLLRLELKKKENKRTPINLEKESKIRRTRCFTYFILDFRRLSKRKRIGYHVNSETNVRAFDR